MTPRTECVRQAAGKGVIFALTYFNFAHFLIYWIKCFSTKVNANPPYLNDYSSNDELEVKSLPNSDYSPPITSKRVLAPTTTKEIVRNIKKKTTNNNISNTLNMLLGTEAETAALPKGTAL